MLATVGAFRSFSAPRGLPRAARRRLSLTAAGVVGCLVLQLAGIAHQVVVRHSRCAEHGELVHSEAPLAHAESRQDGVQRLERAAETRADEHEHCAALSDQRKLLAASRAPLLSARELPILSSPASETGADTGRRILAFAPKTSPPQLG